MKNMGTLTVVLAIAVAAFVVCCGEAQDAPASKKTAWEYKVLTVYEVTGVESAFDLLQTDAKQKNTPGQAESKERSTDAKIGETETRPVPGLEEFAKLMLSQTNKRIAEGLDNIGESGWELVAVEEYSFYFKRQRE